MPKLANSKLILSAPLGPMLRASGRLPVLVRSARRSSPAALSFWRCDMLKSLEILEEINANLEAARKNGEPTDPKKS